MPAFSIIHAGVYRSPIRSEQKILTPMIVLLVSGIRYREVKWPGGRALVWRDPQPRFCLDTPGSTIHADFPHGRENWVIQLRSSDFRYDAARQQVQMRDADEWFTMPYDTPIPRGSLPYWRGQLRDICDAWSSATPHDQLWARLSVAEILRFMIHRTRPKTPSAAARLRSLIDEDPNHSQTIDALAAACDFSPAHLRVLFEREFGTTPQAYRNERRMARVMDLIVGGQLPVKQIAAATGFKYTSHLSAAFRNRYGMTVTEAIRRYRRG